MLFRSAKENFVAPEMFEVLDERRYGAARLVLAKAPGEAGPQPITSLT